MSCWKCGSDSNVVGCVFEGCDHYWCRFHSLKIRWRRCHRRNTGLLVRMPQDHNTARHVPTHGGNFSTSRISIGHIWFSQKPKGSPKRPPELASPSARMFYVGPVPEPEDPMKNLNPNNPPDPDLFLGRSVLLAANRLCKDRIGRRKDNIGYYHDSSPSDAYLDLTFDEDFDEHPELAAGPPERDRRIIETALHMRFNQDFPYMDKMDASDPEARLRPVFDCC
eukprot:1799672-Amphidinium_carterae.1